jgi:hypothetical protein
MSVKRYLANLDCSRCKRPKVPRITEKLGLRGLRQLGHRITYMWYRHTHCIKTYYFNNILFECQSIEQHNNRIVIEYILLSYMVMEPKPSLSFKTKKSLETMGPDETEIRTVGIRRIETALYLRIQEFFRHILHVFKRTETAPCLSGFFLISRI